MKTQISQNDGWLPMEQLMKFNKLKQITTDDAVVIEALKKSKSGLLEISECGKKIRRALPMPELSKEYIDDLNLRTIHMKGFPKDSKFDDIKAFCYNDVDLLMENKNEYTTRKQEYHKSRREKKKQLKAQVVKTEGALMKIKNLSTSTKFIDIKNEITKHSKVAFVTAIDESGQCYVRFAEKNGAKTFLNNFKKDSTDEELGADIAIDFDLLGQKVQGFLVSGDEEKEYWSEFNQNHGKNVSKKSTWQRGKKRPIEDENDKNESENKTIKISKNNGHDGEE
ncbi:Lupus La -like protein [Sarcoptes scabiei]|uniref:Lupus La -like protein n=1 Tax=Sarcoptes scabiei TaxID=52283 RepID=A0A834R348_SARSC|nr:Lupus La -like protein [Sarcoptes scabiei]